MTNVPNSIAAELLTSTPAANEDRIDDHRIEEVPAPPAPALSETGGWDAHEVWRRTIKEARDRRRSNPPPEF
jgi:hypothetical protein